MVEINMLNRQKIDEYLLSVFKAGIAIRVCCLFTKVLLARYNLADSIISHVITVVSITMLVITTGIIIYKAVTIFNKNHKELLTKHRHATIIIEFIVMRIVFFLLFINQRVASKFVLYLNNLSETKQQGSFIFLIIVLVILVGRYLKRIINLHNITLTDRSVRKRLFIQFKMFLFKICIVIGTLILMFYSPFKFLQPRNIYIFIQSIQQEITRFALQYIHSHLFFYIHCLFIFGFFVWILFDIYSVYRMHREDKKL